MHAAFDHLLSPVAVFGKDLVLVYFNQAFSAFFQLPPRKLRGKGVQEILRTDGDEAARLAAQCAASGEAAVSPEVAVTGGAEPKEVVLKFFPVPGEGGETLVGVTLQDFSIERVLHEKHRAQLDEIKRYSEGLEVLVDERTRELVVAKEETESILRSIREGLIVVMPDLTLSEKCSLAAPALLGLPEVKGVPVLAALFPDAQRSKGEEDRKKIETFLASAFNLFIPDQFDDLARYAPRQIRYPGGEGEPLRVFSLSFSAVVENDAVARVVVALRDDTELEELRQHAVTIHKKIVEALEQVAMRRGEPAFKSFAREMAKLAREAAPRAALTTPDELATLFRALHTVKGSTRQFALAFLQHFAHEAETVIDAFRAAEGAQPDDEKERLQNDVQWLVRGLEALEALTGDGVEEGRAERRDGSDEARAWRSAVAAIKEGFDALAADLGKKARLSFASSQALGDEERAFLESVLVHLLRNALDHGVEAPERRLAAGKHPEAAVSVRVSDEGDRVTVLVEDDGAGIDRVTVRERGVARGVLAKDAGPLSFSAALDVLAAPGFTTKDAVTDVSGRGVGLDAVRASLRARGGDVALVYSGPTGTKLKFTWQKAEALRAAG